MLIDCRWCDTRGGACQDCVVAVIAQPSAARHLEAEELRALGVLADAGMIPSSRPSDAPARPAEALRTSGAPKTWAFPTSKAS